MAEKGTYFDPQAGLLIETASGCCASRGLRFNTVVELEGCR
jgi:hypothetical protein